MDERIRILFLAADPSELTRTRLGKEFQIINDELEKGREGHRFVLRYQFGVQIETLAHALMDFNPHIIHFSGHGSPKGELCFEDSSGRAKKVRVKDLARLLALHAVECVILNACYSGRQAGAISKHILYVIGIKELITEPAAHYFSLGFYQALSSGLAIEAAFERACALVGIEGGSSKPVLKKRPVMTSDTPESARASDRAQEAPLLPPLDRGPPRSWLLLGSCALIVLVALGVPKLNTGGEPVRHEVEGRRIEIPFFVDIAPARQLAQGEAHVAIKVLGAASLPDGRIEVRGEVQPEQPTDLSAFHVEVTFDGESQVGFIDANTRTWKVFFEQDHSRVPGKKLELEVLLVGVQPAGSIS